MNGGQLLYLEFVSMECSTLVLVRKGDGYLLRQLCNLSCIRKENFVLDIESTESDPIDPCLFQLSLTLILPLILMI